MHRPRRHQRFLPTLFALPPTLFALPPTLFALPPTLFALPPTLFALPPTLFALPPSAIEPPLPARAPTPPWLLLVAPRPPPLLPAPLVSVLPDGVNAPVALLIGSDQAPPELMVSRVSSRLERPPHPNVAQTSQGTIQLICALITFTSIVARSASQLERPSSSSTTFAVRQLRSQPTEIGWQTYCTGVKHRFHFDSVGAPAYIAAQSGRQQARVAPWQSASSRCRRALQTRVTRLGAAAARLGVAARHDMQRLKYELEVASIVRRRPATSLAAKSMELSPLNILTDSRIGSIASAHIPASVAARVQ